jgi:hypothetical protein
MSMRIQTDGLAGAAGLETSRAQETNGVAQSGKQRGAGASGSPLDSVQISGLSERIAEASADLDAQSDQRVNALAALYASGKYEVDSKSLSRSMVSQSLSGAVFGGGE